MSCLTSRQFPHLSCVLACDLCERIQLMLPECVDFVRPPAYLVEGVRLDAVHAHPAVLGNAKFLDDALRPEQAKVAAHGRLRDAKEPGQLAGRPGSCCQRDHDAPPGPVAEHVQRRGVGNLINHIVN